MSSRAFASIPRSTVLDAPAIDRFAVADRQAAIDDDNALLVARSLAAALPERQSIAATIDVTPPLISDDVVPQQLRVFGAHVVIRKLATRTKFFASQSNVSEFSGLCRKLRRDMKFQALPFQEPATGLVFARARWYDPTTGSFLSPDPLGYRDSSNLYTFAGGGPVNGRDPDGRAVSRGNSGIFVISDVRDGKRGKTYRITTQWVMQHKAMFAAILDRVAGVRGIAALQYMDAKGVGIGTNTDQTIGGLSVAMAQVDEALKEATKAYLVTYAAVATGGVATYGLSATGASTFTATTVGNLTAGVAAQGTSDAIDQKFSGAKSYLSAGATTATVGWVFEGGGWVLKQFTPNEVGAIGPGTPSIILRESLKKAGIKPPPFPNAAHHIVASDAVIAQEARAHLEALGIGVNDAETECSCDTRSVVSAQITV